MPSKKIEAMRRAKGVCINCNSELDTTSKIKCRRCLKINSRSVAKMKQRYVEQRRCRECSKPLPTPEDDKLTCPGCAMRPRFDRIFQKIN